MEANNKFFLNLSDRFVSYYDLFQATVLIADLAMVLFTIKQCQDLS